jgi:hypothetical protein
MNAVRTKHNLDFEVSEWEIGMITKSGYDRFRIGTVTGLWRCTPISYNILAIENSEKGNGHLEDVFEWFENSCKRDKKNLVVEELLNEKFKTHLITQRGFTKGIHERSNHVYKYHNNMK